MNKRTTNRWWIAVCIIVALFMIFSLAPTSLLAEEQADQVPEWAIDDGNNTQDFEIVAEAGLPSSYDMRAEDLVTPVKNQSPWSTCWSFGGIAAAP